MIWFAVCPILILLIWPDWSEWKYMPRLWHRAKCIGEIVLCILGGAIMAWPIAYIANGFFPWKVEKAWDIPLVAIRDKTYTSGQFFLGSGSIQEKPYYFFYVKQDDGAIEPWKVEANSCVDIYEEKRLDAFLVRYRVVQGGREPWLTLLSLSVAGHLTCEYEFHVPVGTIQRGYTM